MSNRGYDPSLENIDGLLMDAADYEPVCGDSGGIDLPHPNTWMQIENQGSRPSCFPAGLMVTMADGTERDIADVDIGNWVITHTGDTGCVVNKMKRHFVGNLKEVTVSGEHRPILCTPEHKFFLPEGNEWQKAQDLFQKTHLLATKRRMTFQFNQQSISLLDYLPTDTIYDDESSSCKLYSAVSGTWVPSSVVLNAQFGRLIGLYLAEGGVHKGPDGRPKELTWTFHIDEKDFQKEVVDSIRDIFGVVARTSERIERNTCKVEVSNVTLSAFFYCFCGERIDTKHVPLAIQNAADAECRYACLRGWLDGDGHVNNDRIAGSGNVVLRREVTAVSVSENLVLSMRRVSLDLGYSPSVRTARQSERRRAYYLNFYGTDAERLMPGQYPERAKPQSRRTRPHEYGYTRPVKDLQDIPFDGVVYDLTIEGDHSYLVNGIAVHNCVGHGASSLLEYLIYLGSSGQVIEQLNRMFAWTGAQKAGGSRPSQSQGASIYGAAKLLIETGLPPEDVYPYSNAFRSEFPPEVYEEAAKRKALKKYELDTADKVFDFQHAGMGGICWGIPWNFKRGAWHCVTSIGTPIDGKLCVANSWGLSDGEKGWHYWDKGTVERYLGVSGSVAIGISDLATPQVREMDWNDGGLVV